MPCKYPEILKKIRCGHGADCNGIGVFRMAEQVLGSKS
jgi:hypothetical protein